MELSKYLGKKVRIDLTIQNYFYEGVVINVEADSLQLRDRKQQLVTISSNTIAFIREVQS